MIRYQSRDDYRRLGSSTRDVFLATVRDNQRCASYIDCPVVCGSQWDVVGHEVQSVEAHVLPHVHRRNDADLQFLDLLVYTKIFIFLHMYTSMQLTDISSNFKLLLLEASFSSFNLVFFFL